MEFRDLKMQYNALKTSIDNNINKAITSSHFILGSQVKEFENITAEYIGVKRCVSCANGTDALQLVLMAWEISDGDAIFAPDFTYFATVNCAMLRGATPILVDIDDRSYNMSPEALETSIIKTIKEGKLKPRVIIPVDLFGQCANYEKICEIAKKYNLKILEDAAQSFGASLNGKKACSFGDAGITSFFPAKPLGCYGDGGAIYTDDTTLADKLESMRAQGRSPEDKYDNCSIGLNSRLDTIQAAILLSKFKALIEYEATNIDKAAKKYTDILEKYVVTPFIPKNYRCAWAQYTILLKNESERDALKSYLAEFDIPTMVYYPRGMHQQTALQQYNYRSSDFPNTENIVKRCLSLPIHPYITDIQIELITEHIIQFLT